MEFTNSDYFWRYYTSTFCLHRARLKSSRHHISRQKRANFPPLTTNRVVFRENARGRAFFNPRSSQFSRSAFSRVCRFAQTRVGIPFCAVFHRFWKRGRFPRSRIRQNRNLHSRSVQNKARIFEIAIFSVLTVNEGRSWKLRFANIFGAKFIAISGKNGSKSLACKQIWKFEKKIKMSKID